MMASESPQMMAIQQVKSASSSDGMQHSKGLSPTRTRKKEWIAFERYISIYLYIFFTTLNPSVCN